MNRLGATNDARAWRIWRAVRLVAAGFVLFAIGADVTDARCHPAVEERSATSVSAASSTGSQDPCRTGCVPDCFCCSTLSPSPVVPLVEVSALAVPVEPLAAPRFEPGVLSPPYHPPLADSLS